MVALVGSCVSARADLGPLFRGSAIPVGIAPLPLIQKVELATSWKITNAVP
jgi:hypothetical protein